jgi:hypothetical protein
MIWEDFVTCIVDPCVRALHVVHVFLSLSLSGLCTWSIGQWLGLLWRMWCRLGKWAKGIIDVDNKTWTCACCMTLLLIVLSLSHHKQALCFYCHRQALYYTSSAMDALYSSSSNTLWWAILCCMHNWLAGPYCCDLWLFCSLKIKQFGCCWH